MPNCPAPAGYPDLGSRKSPFGSLTVFRSHAVVSRFRCRLKTKYLVNVIRFETDCTYLVYETIWNKTQFACVSFECVDDAEIFVYIIWLYSNYTANVTGRDALRSVSCDVSARQYASSLVSDVVSKITAWSHEYSFWCLSCSSFFRQSAHRLTSSLSF